MAFIARCRSIHGRVCKQASHKSKTITRCYVSSSNKRWNAPILAPTLRACNSVPNTQNPNLATKQISTARPSPLNVEFPKYTYPSSGIISYLPKALVPYAELARIDKPAGAYYLFFPCLFSTLLAAPLAIPITPPLTVLGTAALFFGGALIMRGAGCTINDLWDRNL